MVPSPSHAETIVFGGGCFWCTEAVFQRLRGVESVTSGYAGGAMADPSYHAVASERTGHAEVVRVEFDPAVIQLDTLLDVFFSTHDPTTLNRQGHDAGTQYRSAVFFTTDEQKAVVEKYIAALTADRAFDKPIVTEVKPFTAFF